MAPGANGHTVDLVQEDGTHVALDAGDGTTILEASDEANIDLRYGCREGKCVSCTGLLLEGDVEYITEPESLNEDQREEGFVLLCISEPTEECKVEVGKHVLGEAFPNLWRTESNGSGVESMKKARRKLRTVDDVDIHEKEHMDHMRGAMGIFPNLHEISEAYYRTDAEKEG